MNLKIKFIDNIRMMEKKEEKVNFCIEDYFCNDIDDLMHHLGIDEEEVKDLDEDWSIDIQYTELESMFQLTSTDLNELIGQAYEDRYSDDPDSDDAKIKKILEECIDFEKLNAKIPKMYYAKMEFDKITKQDLIDYIS